MILLSYKFINIVPFGDGEYKSIYELTFLKKTFFGLFNKKVVMTYDLSMFDTPYHFESHWDNLIETKQKL